MFLIKFESIGLSVQEKKRTIDFQDGFWISDRKDFSYFLSTGHQVSSQLDQGFRGE